MVGLLALAVGLGHSAHKLSLIGPHDIRVWHGIIQQLPDQTFRSFALIVTNLLPQSGKRSLGWAIGHCENHTI